MGWASRPAEGVRRDAEPAWCWPWREPYRQLGLEERGRLLPVGWCPGRERYLPWALPLAWPLPVCCGQACNDTQSWGCLGPSQGQGSPVLVGSMSQSQWLSSAVGLPQGCESCVGSKQQVKEGNAGKSFWVTGPGAGSWDSCLSSFGDTVPDVPGCHHPYLVSWLV